MLKLAVVLSLAAVSHALFQCPPNYCDRVDCAAVSSTNCDNGMVKEGASFCGCCSMCITQLAEGDSCASSFLLGVPATSECGEGLQCSRSTWKCESLIAVNRAVGPCAARLAEFQKSQTNGIPLLGVEAPNCQTDGNFAPVQCLGSVCYCVDPAGKQIPGYQAGRENTASMNCKCARDLAAYMASGLVGKLFNCDSNGNYPVTQPVQPVQPVVVMTTVKPVLTGVGSGGLTGGQFGEYAAKQDCAVALQSAMGSSLLGRFVPECDADGRYAPRQCQGSECYCVRKDGTKIEGYSSPIALKDRVTCQCARDKDAFASQGLVGRIHTCRHNGNYQQYQCLGSVCYCTDDVGNKVLEKSAPIGDLSNLVCEW